MHPVCTHILFTSAGFPGFPPRELAVTLVWVALGLPFVPQTLCAGSTPGQHALWHYFIESSRQPQVTREETEAGRGERSAQGSRGQTPALNHTSSSFSLVSTEESGVSHLTLR